MMEALITIKYRVVYQHLFTNIPIVALRVHINTETRIRVYRYKTIITNCYGEIWDSNFMLYTG